MRLNTPLQFAEHLNRAFEAGFRTGQKPVTAEIVTTMLAPDFDDLEPRLTCQSCSPKVLADQFHARPSEIRRFLSGQLDAGGMCKVGHPVSRLAKGSPGLLTARPIAGRSRGCGHALRVQRFRSNSQATPALPGSTLRLQVLW